MRAKITVCLLITFTCCKAAALVDHLNYGGLGTLNRGSYGYRERDFAPASYDDIGLGLGISGYNSYGSYGPYGEPHGDLNNGVRNFEYPVYNGFANVNPYERDGIFRSYGPYGYRKR